MDMKLLVILGGLLIAGIFACQAAEEGPARESPVAIDQICSDLEKVEHFDMVWTLRVGSRESTTTYSVSGDDVHIHSESVEFDFSGDETEENRYWAETIFVDGVTYIRGEGYSDVSSDWEKQPEDANGNSLMQSPTPSCFGTSEASSSPGKERYFFVREQIPGLDDDPIEEKTTEYWIDDHGRSLKTVIKRVYTYSDGTTLNTQEKTAEYRIDDAGRPLQLAIKEVSPSLDGTTGTTESIVTYSGWGEPNIVTKPIRYVSTKRKVE